MTPEQQARDMMERAGWDGAQSCSAGDLVEIANLIADNERLWVLLDLAAHTIIDHQRKEISARWCRYWEMRYRQLAADRDGAADMTRCQWCGACVSDDDPCERPSDYCLHNLPTYKIPTNKHTTTDGQLHEGLPADCAACGFPGRDG